MLQTRHRYKCRMWDDPRSAVHHCVLHRIRETAPQCRYYLMERFRRLHHFVPLGEELEKVF
jgi:hypothetical protein